MIITLNALLLAAGPGIRLKPLTNHWPKCLMPIGGIPLLEHWLCLLHQNAINNVTVNMHHHHREVSDFLERAIFLSWVTPTYEEKILGTAGTIVHNYDAFCGQPMLLAHADNWIQCDLHEFIEFHRDRRPKNTWMTMMTFRTSNPSSCGIVQLDAQGVVQNFWEKTSQPHGNLANGAVYLLEPELLEWMLIQDGLTDFSRDVIPALIGKIATWENMGIHRDIGTSMALLAAQNDPDPEQCWSDIDEWKINFSSHHIHKLIRSISSD